jgi:tRNA-dihydrouridine synthase B
LMRKFGACYAQGRPGARYFRTYVQHVTTPEDFRRVVELYFPRDGWLEKPPPHWMSMGVK